MRHRFTEPTPVSRAHGTVVEVFVDSWEIECCAPPPVVGETTCWRLSFVAGGGPYRELDVDRGWQVVRRDTWTALVDGPVVAQWLGERPPQPGRRALRGHLSGSVHGPCPEDVPSTTGTVQRVRVAAQVFRLDEARTLHPVAGTLELADVQTSPRSFSWGDVRIRPGVDVRMETGVLLELTVP